jgi:hypothetical protein
LGAAALARGPAAAFDGISVEDGASRTVSEDQLSDIIGRIYDAALDSALWTEALDRVCEFVGGVAVLAGDSAARGNAIVATTGDVIAHLEFLETHLRHEWTHPQGWIDAVTSALKNEWDDTVDNETPPHAASHPTYPPRGSDRQDRQAERRGGRRPRRRARRRCRIRVFVDATSRLLRANQSGHALLVDSTILPVHEGCLAASDAGANRLLQDALAATSEGGMSLGKRGVSLPLRASDDRHCVAHILLLPAGA